MVPDGLRDQALVAHIKAAAGRDALDAIVSGRWLGTSEELAAVAHLVAASARHARFAELLAA